MMLAYSEGRQQVSARHVRDAAADTPEARRDWMPWAIALTSVAILASLAIIWMELQ